jgi:hypothetical protein
MVIADGESSDFVAVGGRGKCRGNGRSAGVSRIEEVIEGIHCLTARRVGTVVCQSARIQLFL